MRSRHLRQRAGLAAIGLVALTTGCIPHRPHRTYDYQEVGAESRFAARCEPPAPADPCGRADGLPPGSSVCTSVTELRADGVDGDASRRRAACVAHEQHRPQPATAGVLGHDGFDLHLLEFDDEGQPWNSLRQEQTFDVLRRQLNDAAVVVAYVHGWKNDADVCNGNLACFRDVLAILAKGETAYARISGESPRRVIGVYIGWRGGSLRTPVKQLTFWGRKHTAHTIGDNGAVTAVIERLRAIVEASPPRTLARVPIGERGPRPPRTTSMLFVGHSFGGALLYSALATSLNADVGAALQKAVAGEPARDPAPSSQTREKGPGQPMVAETRVRVEGQNDLIILVNPAMEASRFANLQQASHLRYQSEQLPLLVTLASEGDSAVKFFFPIGQSFSTLTRAARSRQTWFSMVEGFGMYKPFHTHRLVAKPGRQPFEATAGAPKLPCACPSRLGQYGDELIRRLEPFYRTLAGLAAAPRDVQLAAYQEFMLSRLEPVRDVDPNNPFLMVKVDPAVVGNHSDIFNPVFLDFLIEFTVRTEIKREALVGYPERSAQ